LAAATGAPASNVSSRAKTVAKVAERAEIDWPSVLDSAQRWDALTTKRLLAEWREANP
jgi:hypothetical protein